MYKEHHFSSWPVLTILVPSDLELESGPKSVSRSQSVSKEEKAKI